MPRERRKHFRVKCDSPAIIWDLDGRSSWPCSLSDFSNGGGKITGILALVIPDEFTLCIARGRARKCHVRWRLPFSLGVEFTDCVADGETMKAEPEILLPVGWRPMPANHPRGRRAERVEPHQTAEVE